MLLPIVLASRPVQSDDLLFDEIAQRWLKRHEAQEAASWQELLERRFAHLELGVFRVYVPVAGLRDGKTLKDTSAALAALLDVQRGWVGWVAGAAPAKTPGKAKEDPLAAWIRGLAPKAFAGELDGTDLAAAADPEVRDALARFAADQRTGKPLGVDQELTGVKIAVFPRRSEFVEFTCVAGALDPLVRPNAWKDDLATWLEYEAGDTRFVTLEYAASTESRDFERGISVGDRNPAAVSELVAQVAGRALIARIFPAGIDPAIASGLANVLVIDLYGELDTRVDGDVRSRSSQGSSAFIPGGNPNGGALPPTSAENRWRGSKGKDHFVGILSQVQKQSGKKGESRGERLARFELVADNGSTKESVHAPFLGPRASAPGAEVFPDYLELVRSYGIAFLHWLKLEGAGKPAESSARFSELLRGLGKGVQTEELPQLFQQVYGQPLSAGDADELFEEPTLEGRFLTWLSKRG